MEYLPNGYRLEIPPDCFPLSTDSMALSHFVSLPRQARVLDLGSGCGTLGLLLCAKDPTCAVTGMEIDPAAHEAALDNIRRNDLSARMESICADLKSVSGIFPPGHFSVCVSNPPYFSGGPGSRKLTGARREDSCTLEDLIRAAAWALKFGGDLFLVHRPERLGEILSLGGKYGFEGKRLGFLRHRPGAAVNLILLQLRKGAKPGLRWEEIILRNEDGSPSEAFREIYHLKEN